MSALVFFLSSYCLGWHCLLLSPVVLGWLLFYSYTKRFTSGAHFVLGVALALAPGGVWFALTGIYSWQPVWMMAGVLCWVAGFDIMYSCQDLIFDRQQGLHSVPVFLGESKAFLLARCLHALALGFLAVFGLAVHLGSLYFFGLIIFGFFLLSQHRLVGPGRLELIDRAFFTRNGQASICFFLAVVADVYL
jgi:4-hydroxybenzoate polyprenyltransferase